MKLIDDDILVQQYCNAQKVEVSGGCQYITGEGLTPLQGSSVLEQIDISLVGKHRHPAIEPEPMISEAPILYQFSIVLFCYRWLFIKIQCRYQRSGVSIHGHCLLC